MKNKWLQWGIGLAVMAALAWFFRDHLNVITDGIARLKQAAPLPIALSIVFAFSALFMMAEVMRGIMHAGGVKVSPLETNAITFASNAWSTTLPVGGAFSAILTYNVQRAWGASVMLCGYFLVLSSALSTMWLVLIGLAAFFLQGANVSPWSLFFTLLAALAITGAVFWASKNPATLERWVRSIPKVPQYKLDPLVAQIRLLNDVTMTRGQFALISFQSLANRLLDLAALWAAVWAVTGVAPLLNATADHTTAMGVALAFISTKLAGSAQVTPGGVGTVEAAMVATLVASGMTAVDATGAALIYRLNSFMLMTIVGWIIYFFHYARKGITYEALKQKQEN